MQSTSLQVFLWCLRMIKPIRKGAKLAIAVVAALESVGNPIGKLGGWNVALGSVPSGCGHLGKSLGFAQFGYAFR